MDFDAFHPLVTIAYVCAVLACTVALAHPACIAVSFLGAQACSVALGGRRALTVNLVLAALAVLWGLWFAANTHFGVTGLFATPIGNTVTLEALAFGLSQGFQLAAAAMWLEFAFRVVTADKVVFALGRVSPRLAMSASLAFRLVPVLAAQARMRARALKGVGRGPGQGGVRARARSLVRRISALCTWGIDHCAQASDSMRARGARLRGRGAYALYSFGNLDRACVAGTALALTVVAVAAQAGCLHASYNPELAFAPLAPGLLAACTAYAALGAAPLALRAALAAAHRRASLQVPACTDPSAPWGQMQSGRRSTRWRDC